MKRLKPLYLSVFTSIILASCDGFLLSISSSLVPDTSLETSSEVVSSEGSSETPTSIPSSSTLPPSLPVFEGDCTPESTPVTAANTEEGFENFFAPTTKVMLDFSLSQASLKAISDNGTRTELHDIYSLASLKIEVTTLDQPTQTYCYPIVGVRMKGNTSRTSFVNNDGLINDFVNLKVSFSSDNPSENRIPNAQFFGMTKLDMKWNRNQDHTQIRQVYSYKMYREFLTMSPEATLGGVSFHQVDVQNSDYQSTYMGLYTLIEPMDRRFFARRLGDGPEADGNLYKLLYSQTGPADFSRDNAVSSSGTTHIRQGNKIGIENNLTNYHPTYDKKTNTVLEDYSDMANLIGLVNETNQYNDEGFRSRLETFIDIEQFIRMEAVAYFIGNPDDFRNNFNNMFVYFVPSTGKAVFIPHDLDRGLGQNGDWDPTENDFAYAGPSMTRLSPFASALLAPWNGNRTNPLHRFTVVEGAISTYQSMYRDALEEIAQSGWLASNNVAPGQFSGSFYDMHYAYRDTYYPTGGDFTYLQPTSPALRDFFVVFSVNQKTQKNITFHDYISGKLNTYQQAIS
jgi:hypothetical protein